MAAITEAVAKTRWCPFVHVAAASIDTHAFTNREVVIGDLPQGEASRCIGSACMAWRLVVKANTSGMARTVMGGYCGLAGKP